MSFQGRVTKLQKAVGLMMRTQPFWASLLMTLNFSESGQTKTITTDGETITYNPAWTEGLSQEEMVGVLAHVAGHCALLHPLRKGHRDEEKWNIACDIVVNGIIRQSGLPVPKDTTIKEDWEKHSAEHIYEMLPDNPTKPKNQQGPGQGKGQGPGAGGSYPNGMPDLESPKDKDGKDISDAEREQREGDMQQRVLAAADLAKKQGKLPAGIEQIINAAAEPLVDWRSVLWNTFQGHTPEDYTWKKLNRKMLGGYKIYMPGSDRIGCGQIIVAFDTSGSVSNDELTAFLSEMNAIIRDMGPERVTIIDCDAQVSHVEEVDGEIPARKFTGRGGTAFAPVFEYVKKHGLEPDQLVYMTDGESGEHLEDPGYPVMFVSTGKLLATAPFAKEVRMVLRK